jgi:hypothetical protein
MARGDLQDLVGAVAVQGGPVNGPKGCVAPILAPVKRYFFLVATNLELAARVFDWEADDERCELER